MKSKEVLNLLKCTRATLSSYVKNEKIKVIKLPNGYYEYNKDDVYKMFNGNIQKNICVFTNKNNLKYIKQYCIKNNFKINCIFFEKQIYELLNAIFNYSIGKIIIDINILNDDKLNIFKFICNKFDIEIIEVK